MPPVRPQGLFSTAKKITHRTRTARTVGTLASKRTLRTVSKLSMHKASIQSRVVFLLHLLYSVRTSAVLFLELLTKKVTVISSKCCFFWCLFAKPMVATGVH